MTGFDNMTAMSENVLVEVNPIAQPLVESAALRVDLTEDVEKFGLDPDVYIAVVQADLGIAGKVNKNRRIYQVEEFVQQNQALSARLQEQFVDGELGHPEGGPTFDVPARLLRVEVDRMGETAKSSGAFGILNTSSGRDVLTLFRAGMDIGTSSRGSGMVEEYVLQEGEPYAEANADYLGETVFLVKDFHLQTYDLVRVPSAGTQLTKELGSPIETPERQIEMAEAKEVEVVEMAAEETQKDVVAENVVAAPVDPFAELSDNQKAILLKLIEAVTLEGKPNNNRLAKEVNALREQMEVDRHRSTVNEAEYQTLREEVANLRAEREERIRKDAVSAAIEECTAERRFGTVVRDELKARCESGALVEAADVADQGERLFTMIESTHMPVAEPVEQATADVADDLVEAVETVEVSTNPSPLGDDLHKSLLATLKRDRA